MPDIDDVKSSPIDARIDQAEEEAIARLRAEFAAVRKDIEEARGAEKVVGAALDLLRPKRLLVKDFQAYEPMRYRRHDYVRLLLPGFREDLVMAQYHSEAVFLGPGRYRAVVAILPLGADAGEESTK